MASPPAAPAAPAVESIDDDGTVSSLGPDGGAGGLMRAFDTAASAENVAPVANVVGTESKGPVAADVVGAASAP